MQSQTISTGEVEYRERLEDVRVLTLLTLDYLLCATVLAHGAMHPNPNYTVPIRRLR